MSVKVVSYREMHNYPDHIILETTSRAKDWGRNFSPFLLGPVDLYNGMIAQNVENGWQYSKVYYEYTDYKNNDPLPAYFEWAEKGWAKRQADRYPLGKGRKPEYCWWDGQKLDYIEARKRIYAPLYAQAVVKTKAFEQLLNLHQNGYDFVLVDFDGYDYLKLGMTLDQVINDPNRKMGHAFVLAMLLEYPALRQRYGYV